MASTGIRARHARACRSVTKGGSCNCTPSFEASVWSKRDGRKIRKTFSGRGALAAAKGWRSDASSAVRKGTLATPTRQTLVDAWDGWLEAVKRGEVLSRQRRPYKPSTIRGYAHDINAYVLNDLGAVRLGEVRPDDLQALVDRLLGQGLSGSKVRNVLVPLQALYRRHRRQVPIDPTDGLDLPASGGRRERVASPAEAFRLIDALPDDDRALWATAFLAGLRRGELRALRAADVNWPSATEIRVSRGWDDVEGDIGPKSGKGERTVPVPAQLRRYLQEHKVRTGRHSGDFLFGRTRSDPFTPSHIRKRAQGAWAATAVCAFFRRESADFAPIGLHECRHTYVSLMHAAGCSLEEIGDYVGHSSAYMTDRYRHLIDGQRNQAAAKLDTFLTQAQEATSV